jgi:hypothetical protein
MVRRHRSVAIALKKNEASEIVGLALEQVVNQRRTLTCVYRKLKPERSGDEVRPRGRVNL